MKSCAFTGHRVLPPEKEDAIRKRLQRGLSYVYQNGVRCFYAGGALGFDTVAAEAVLAFRREHTDVKLFLILPSKDQADRWPLPDRIRYHAIVTEADMVTILSPTYYDGIMRERNQALVDKADVLIAYCCHGGGAAMTVALAKRKKIPIYNLADED